MNLINVYKVIDPSADGANIWALINKCDGSCQGGLYEENNV